MRDAVAADARSILELRRRSWRAAYSHIFPAAALAAMTVEPWISWWQDRIQAPADRMHTLVAERNAEIVGFAQLGAALEADGAELGELYAIYVCPDAWDLGVGRALMAESLLRLRNEGFSGAVLWVLEDNPRSRRFYERAGWHADGGVKEDEWLDTLVREVRYRIGLAPAV